MSNFREDHSINAICHHILDDKTKHELIHGKIPKEPKGKVIKQRHISELGIRRKCNILFDKIKQRYPDKLKEDKEFLNFFGTLRNCMHNNYIYYGEKYEYIFENVKYVFEDGKSFHNEAYKPLDSKHFFNLALKLIEVYKKIALSIEYPSLIPYPDPDTP